MGRPRKTNTHLPPCVYPRHGAYYLVKAGKWTLLGHTLSDALKEYASRFESPSGGMEALIEEAFPVITAKSAANTKRQYRYAANKVKHMLAEFAPDQVQQRHIARVKLALADMPNMANICLSVTRQVFAYAVENQLLDNNPAIGIKPYPVKSRPRLISKAEFEAIYAKADDQLQVFMDLLYLTGRRPDHVLKLAVSSITQEGIYFGKQKTDAQLIVKWNPQLRTAVERAKTLSGNVRALTLLHERGKPLRLARVRERWIEACAAAGVENAQLRDLRAMSGTDAKRQGLDPQALLGHTTPKTTEVYLRGKEIPAVDGPSFGQLLDIGQKKQENQ
jgi:integrase